MDGPRVIVVGAGPAGVRAAATLVAAGITPTVIEEGRRDGGQIYRRQPDGFVRPYALLYGSEALKAAALHRTFDGIAGQIVYRPGTLAWNLTDGALHVVSGTAAETLPFDALIVCSGATDRLMPVEGWNLPGTYSLGAAQIALKSQACAIGRNVVFLGTGPLLYLVAAQYHKAGAGVAAVLDTAPASLPAKALPKLLARPHLLARGMLLIAGLRRAGVPVLSGVTPIEIGGAPETGVAAVRVRDRSGQERSFACDAVALGYHLRPETQLADLARCAFVFDPASRQFVPQIDPDGRSSVRGVYLAGDGARILGADGAEAAGELAALAAIRDLGRTVSEGRMARLRRVGERMDRFRRGLAEAFPWPATQAADLPDKAIVCRCEAVTVGTLRAAVRDMGASEVNRGKAFSRVGMGRCQGRYCGHAAAEIVAAATGVPIEAVGRLRGQAPVKPLPIAAMREPA